MEKLIKREDIIMRHEIDYILYIMWCIFKTITHKDSEGQKLML